MRKTLIRLLSLLLLLLLFCSCQKCKSSEEGEAFLKSIQRNDGAADLSYECMKDLLEAEVKYDFTTEQLLRLKGLQVYFMSSALTEDEIRGICDEIEQLTIKTGNDSVLIFCKTIAFSVMCQRFPNPDKLLTLLKQDKPLLIEKRKWNELRRYYAGISFNYKRSRNYDLAIHYALASRPYVQNLMMWYVNMGDNMLDAKRYSQAIMYADSIFVLNDKSLPINNRGSSEQNQIRLTREILGYRLKCRSFSALGKTERALALYKIAEAKIEEGRENFRQISLQRGKSDTIGYAAVNIDVLYSYALLLKQTGHINDAVRVLEKIAFCENYKYSSYPNDDTDISLRIPRLQADCYSLLGNEQRSRYYSLHADSMAVDMKRQEVERVVNANSQELSNLQLSDGLAQKMHQVRMAKVAQYVMILVIGVLLTLIVVGWLWWKERRRRMQRLFEQMIYRHAVWAELQLSAGQTTTGDLNIQTTLSEQDGGVQCKNIQGYEKLPECGDLSGYGDLQRGKGLPKCEDMQKSGDLSGYENHFSEEDGAKSNSVQPLHYPIIYRKLNHIMKEKAFFLDPNCELVALSCEAGISRTLLSNVLNRHAGMNFKDWLAEYRVNYLLEQMKLHPDIEIGELYPKAGFTSRATFFRQFRNVTGLTPKQYLSRLGYNSAVDETE